MSDQPAFDPSRWRQICDLFQAAIARVPAERPAFVAAACVEDHDLAQTVAELLRAHDSAGDFLEEPAAVRFVADTGFTGTDRFAVRRRLGAGGMGVVYEVHDRTRDQVVALKTLLLANPTEIYHLKHEFRGLADIAHRNLVSLYELVVDGPHAFFTMELVNGVDLVRHVREPCRATEAERIDRLRDRFQQLAEGLAILHRHGKLHRDIKPSNVLVTPEGRVVILDFGLIADVTPGQTAGGDRPGGTPAYISPEAIAGGRATEASDWYSVGITLYHALTGRVPFERSFGEQRRRAHEAAPQRPSQLAADVPDDLEAICMDLIAHDQNRRLLGRDALLALASPTVPSRARSGAASETSGEPPFVGRAEPLAVLQHEFLTAAAGRPASVYIHGPSGIGKSTLIRRFLDRLPASSGAVILRGRCYEQESVPYKALDGVIDSLSLYLASLPRAQASALLPRDVLALSRLFPVMLQVEAVAARPAAEQVPPDPFVLRRRGFAALRELLASIARRHPTIFYIDDLHWSDADSAVLLEELLRPPHAPPLLTILCFRSEETVAKPFLQALLERSGSEECVTLSLGPMEDDEAHELIGSLIPSSAAVTKADRLRIAREAAGNPFFLEQLSRYVAIREDGSDRPATFADMLGARLRVLPAPARHFLDALALCGRPMAPQLVHEACGLTGDERPLVASLRSAHLVRSSGSAERVVLYHDRLRHTLAGNVAPAQARRIHAAMARTLVARRTDDAEALFEHYDGAGDYEQASAQAALAAKKANAALAFDRAGFYYRRALELAPGTRSALEWKTGLATALANAGRPSDAAHVFLDASSDAPTAQQIELQRRAAEQFLIGGHIDQGLGAIRTVLAALGMRLARGPRTALASLLIRRLRLRWRGLDFVERAEDRVSADDLLRIDTCWSVVTGLALVDNIRAADFQTRHLRLALDAGEPFRIVRALAVEAGFRASGNGPRRQGATLLAERANAMAQKVGHPHAIALSTLTSGMAALLVGEWKQATLECGRALEILRDRCVGTTWETNLAQNFFLGSLLFRGELRDVGARLPDLLNAAHERGNLYFETELRTRMNLVWLVADQPDEGERQANEAMQRWSGEGFHRQHYNHMLARIQTELYRGRAEQAWQLIEGHWPAMRRTYLFRIQFLRIEASYLRGRCALLMADASGDSRRHLSAARQDARRIAREGMAWSDPLALLLTAAIACREGQRDLAIDRLSRAAGEFDRTDMHLYAAAARRRLGGLVKGDRGRELRARANEWMTSQEVKNPARLTRMLAPGFPDEDDGACAR